MGFREVFYLMVVRLSVHGDGGFWGRGGVRQMMSLPSGCTGKCSWRGGVVDARGYTPDGFYLMVVHTVKCSR